MATELLLTTRDTFSLVLNIHIKQTTFWYEKELYIPTVFQDSPWFWISVQHVPKWSSDMTRNFHVGTPCGSVYSDEEKLLGFLPQSQVNDCGGGTHEGRKSNFLDSSSVKPVAYSGTREQQILQWCFSMAVNKYAQAYKQVKITVRLLMVAKVCTKNLYKSLTQMCQCAFKLKMCPYTYHITWCSHSQQEHPILGCTKPCKSNLAYVLLSTTTKFC